jgi:hypothetical protein
MYNFLRTIFSAPASNLNPTTPPVVLIDYVCTGPTMVVRWGYTPDATSAALLRLQCHRKLNGLAIDAARYGTIQGKTTHLANDVIYLNPKLMPNKGEILNAGDRIQVAVTAAAGATLAGQVILELQTWGLNTAAKDALGNANVVLVGDNV